MDSEEYGAQWQALAGEVLSGMSAWRRAHPKATFAEIERETDRRLASLRASLLAEVAQQSEMVTGGSGPARAPCPQCGGATRRNGTRTRRLTTQHEQTVELARQQLRCGVCGHTFFPPG
jgi:hypothetical protein